MSKLRIFPKLSFRVNCWTCTLFIFGAGLLAILGSAGQADADECPPTKECRLMERAYQGCSKKNADDCARFVRHYATLAAGHCNKKSELETSERRVAALQVCDAHKDFTLANYTEMLASLNTPDAQKLFSSERFRQAVAKTPVGEEYGDRSKELEKTLAETAKPKSRRKDSGGVRESADPIHESNSEFKKSNTDMNAPEVPAPPAE